MCCNCDRNPDDQDMADMMDNMRQQPDYFGGMVALTRDMFEESQAEKDASRAYRDLENARARARRAAVRLPGTAS